MRERVWDVVAWVVHLAAVAYWIWLIATNGWIGVVVVLLSVPLGLLGFIGGLWVHDRWRDIRRRV